MVKGKARTNDQYQKWLSQPFNSTFGCSYDSILNYMNSYYSNTWNGKLRAFGVSQSWWTNTAVPMIENKLGKGAWLMLMGIIGEEGGGSQYGWINHTSRGSDPVRALQLDLDKINEQLYSTAYPAVSTAPEINGSMSPSAKNQCQAMLNTIPKGAIGRYYMTMTLAGNAWVFDPTWANILYPQWGGLGNPYDGIMNMIEKCGGDPYNGQAVSSGSGGSGSGGSTGDGNTNLEDEIDKYLPDDMDEFISMLNIALQKGWEALQDFLDKLFPKAVYLNNSKFSVLGIIFRRYQQYLYLTYPWENFELPEITIPPDILNPDNGNEVIPDESGNGNTTNSSGNNNEWYNKILAELNKIRPYQNQFVYDNHRPCYDLTVTRRADCSAFVGWISRTAFPAIYSNGYGYTGTQKQCFVNGTVGRVIIEGTQTYVAQHLDQLKAGDYILMGTDYTCGAGNYSHIAWCETPSRVWSMELAGLLTYSASYYFNTWWSYHNYICICRPN